MAPKRMVAVYDQDGNKFIVDNLNAIDMVTSLNYMYKPGTTFNPADNLPYALASADLLKKDPQGKKLAQAILDGVSSTVEEPDDDDDADGVFDAGTRAAPAEIATVLPPARPVAGPAAPVAVAHVFDAAAEESQPPKAEAPKVAAPAKAGRGRPKKS